MTAARQQYHWTPFRMTFAEVAEAVFRRGETWLRANLPRYPSFPAPDQDGLFHAGQVEEWVNGCTHVYFIQMGEDGPIKIGRADRPSSRLRELQTGNPHKLRLIGKFKAPRDAEPLLHSLFPHHRLEGEWFKPDSEILSLVSRLGTIAVPVTIWEVLDHAEAIKGGVA